MNESSRDWKMQYNQYLTLNEFIGSVHNLCHFIEKNLQQKK